MFPLFHIFLPLFIVEMIFLLKRNKFDFIKRFWVIIGSILPDLIDKPISIITKTTSGRGVGHTPLFLIVLTFTLYLLLPKKEISISIGFGMIFHLILDIPEVPWLWPLIPLVIYDADIESWLYTLLHNPLIISTEIIGLFGLLGILFQYKIIFREKFVNWKNLNVFLFENHQNHQIIKNSKS